MSESRHTFRADGPGRYKHFAVPVRIEKKSNSCRRDSNHHDDTFELVFVDVLAVEPAAEVAACEFVDVWADELPEPALTELDVEVDVCAPDDAEPPGLVEAEPVVPVDAWAPPAADPLVAVPVEPVEAFDDVPVDAWASCSCSG